MDKEEIKKHCDAIEEILTDCLDTYVEREDVEDVLEHLRALRGESSIKRVILTTKQRKLIDLINDDYELDDVYMETKQGWAFLVTPENLELFEKTVSDPISELVCQIKDAMKE